MRLWLRLFRKSRDFFRKNMASVRGFCWGFWEKRGVERGFWMVIVWWIRGETWWV
jgi:hypothetical protein